MSRFFRGLAFGMLLVAAAACAALGLHRATYQRTLVASMSSTESADANEFPSVDLSALRITLQRSACLGACPDYIVTLAGDGSVVFTTDYKPSDGEAALHRMFSPSIGVVVPGTRRTKVDPSRISALVEQFRAARFFNLKNEYRSDATDGPTYVVSIDTGHGSKKIIDYMGDHVGMPPAIEALEDAIDKVAGTRRWIEGTSDAIPALEAEGFRFDSAPGRHLLAKAAERGEISTMERLHALGAPLAGAQSSGPMRAAAAANQTKALSWLLTRGAATKPAILMDALSEAVRSDSHEAFDLLRDLIKPDAITPEIATVLLRQAAENGNVRMTSFFLRFGPRLNGLASDSPMDEPPLWAAANGSCRKKAETACNHREVVKLLLAAGSNPRWFHPTYRNSVFFQVDDPEVAKMLLARGADPNFKDTDGEPVIFSIYDEDVALAMIDSGVSLRSVRPADKMTLRGWATYKKWSRVLAKLDKAGLLKTHQR